MKDILGLCIFLLVAVTFIGLPVIWIISEYRDRRWLRIFLGVMTIVSYVFCCSFIYGLITRLEYNDYFGLATGDLIKTSIEQIEDGNLDRVLKVWRGLDFQYQPTYENRARYQELAEEAMRLMKGDPIQPESPWDTSMFDEATWHGHWEGDQGFWLIIGDGNPFDIVYYSYSLDEPQSISVSPDYTVLTFKVYGTVLHRITLQNKYEALHEWFEIENNKLLGEERLYKLIRASEEQKRMTQRENNEGEV